MPCRSSPVQGSVSVFKSIELRILGVRDGRPRSQRCACKMSDLPGGCASGCTKNERVFRCSGCFVQPLPVIPPPKPNRSHARRSQRPAMSHRFSVWPISIGPCCPTNPWSTKRNEASGMNRTPREEFSCTVASAGYQRNSAPAWNPCRIRLLRSSTSALPYCCLRSPRFAPS